MYEHNGQKIFGTEKALEEFKRLFGTPKVKVPKTPDPINKEPGTPNYPPPQTPDMPPPPAPKSAEAKHRPPKHAIKKDKEQKPASKKQNTKPEDGTPIGVPGSISQLDVHDAISEVTEEKPPAKIEQLGGLHQKIMECLELVQ